MGFGLFCMLFYAATGWCISIWQLCRRNYVSKDISSYIICNLITHSSSISTIGLWHNWSYYIYACGWKSEYIHRLNRIRHAEQCHRDVMTIVLRDCGTNVITMRLSYTPFPRKCTDTPVLLSITIEPREQSIEYKRRFSMIMNSIVYPFVSTKGTYRQCTNDTVVCWILEHS